MRLWGWVVRIVLYIAVSTVLTVLHARLQGNGMLRTSYWMEWLMVIVGIYGWYLGAILYGAVIVGGSRLIAARIRRLRI